jgi:hypothetical protein
MPIHIFTEAERAKLDTFPEEITRDDLITFFTLTKADQQQLPRSSTPHNRLGFALQLCTLRFMGFVPEELTRIPSVVVEYVAEQIGVEPLLVNYGVRAQTRTDHFTVVQHYLGYRKAEQTELTSCRRGCWNGRWNMTNRRSSLSWPVRSSEQRRLFAQRSGA